MSAAHPDPLSPAISPRSTSPSSSDLGVNLKIPNATQDRTQGSYEPDYPAHLPPLEQLAEDHNRHSIPILGCKDFENLVHEVLREHGVASLTTELSERMRRIATESNLIRESTKRDVFLKASIPERVSKLLPFIQEETLQGYSRFICDTLGEMSRPSSDLSEQSSVHLCSKEAPASPPFSLISNTSNVSHASAKPRLRPHNAQRTVEPILRRQQDGRVRKVKQGTTKPPRRSVRLQRAVNRQTDTLRPFP